MSGFEVAGVLIGAIPLIISGLEHYSQGVSESLQFVKSQGPCD